MKVKISLLVKKLSASISHSLSSIRIQMAVVISLFSLIAVLGFLASIFSITHQQLRQQKAESISQEMQGYSQVIKRQLEEFDYVAADDLVKMSLSSPNIIAMAVENEFGQEISQHPKELPAADSTAKVYQRDLYNAQSESEKVGRIKIWWIQPEAPINVDLIYQRLPLIGLLFVIILSTLIYHSLAFSIAKPLSQLEKKLLDFKPEFTFKQHRYVSREILSLQDHYVRMANKVQKQMEHLETLARTDTLTQLASRSKVDETIQSKIELNGQLNKKFSVLFLDLDHFKNINDVYGHNTGDQVLIGLAETLQNSIDKKDLLGRFGGDEFVLIIDDTQKIDTTVNAIYRQLDKEFIVDGRRIFLSVSIGIAIWPKDGESRVMLLRNADIALYQSKRNGRNQSNYFSQGMEQAANDRLHTIDAVRAAMQRDSFTFHWQPIINQSKQLEWYELLIRLANDDGTMLAPDVFLPIAEENGLMKSIVQFTCEFAHDLLVAAPDQQLNLSINFSRSQILLPDLDEILAPLLSWKKQVIIEVTEEAFLGDTQTCDILVKLRSRGFRIALDDFGSGFSSLALLLDLPIDIVKLDKEFQKNIQQRDDARTMLKSIISMLHALGKEVVAEGIQHEAQYDFAVESGCQYLQGYYFQRPTPVSNAYEPFKTSRAIIYSKKGQGQL